jgi:hypothetical protein
MVAKTYNSNPALWIHFSRLWESVAKTWAAQGSASEVGVKQEDQLRSVRLCVIMFLKLLIFMYI